MTLPEPIAAYWAARTGRERRLLALLGLVIAGVVGWYGVVDPLRAGASDARDDRAASARRLEQAEHQAAVIRAARPRGVASAGRLDALLTETAAAAGLTLGARTASVGGVQVTIEAAPAPALFSWIADLDARGVRATQVSVLRGDSGTVRATLTFAG